MKDTVLSQAIDTVLRRAFPCSNVRDFSIKAGSADGDNYIGIMYSITALLEPKDQKGQTQKMHLILKTSPENLARKEFGDDLQLFNKEAAFYKTVIPELLKFQGLDEKLILPAFVKCYDAKTSEFGNNKTCDGTPQCIHCLPKLPWDYILMENVCENGGFRMANRFTGVDFNHCELVVSELARYHALSYAYMKRSTAEDAEVFKKFPFLKEAMISKQNESTVRSMYKPGGETCLKILETAYPADSYEYGRLKQLIEGAFNITAHVVAGSTDLSFGQMVSTPVDLTDVNLIGRERKKRNQWLTLSHGDCWVNNFLFRYCGEKPIGVKLVDLQIVREICLTTDLAYFFYMSTTAELRRKHLNQLLQIYFDTFKGVCTALKVEAWPDFTLDNLKRKYKQTMIYGAATALCFLPVILLPKESCVDMEKESTSDNIFGSVFTKAADNNENLNNRVLSTAQEVLAAGLLD